MRSFEYLLINDNAASFISDKIKKAIGYSEGEMESTSGWTLDTLCLPSFAATNSLVANQEISLTNIFSLPFVAGPASSISAVYTALDTAHRVGKIASSSPVSSSLDEETDTTVDQGDLLMRSLEPPTPTWKTIIVLDLDLYAKAYKLVNSRNDLRNQYVLCLGELHIVFAQIRAIGTFIDSSGIDDAWMAAEWFDSESLLRQVKECSNMKRALAAHEATLLAVNTIILQGALSWFQDIKWFDEELLSSLKTARDVIARKNMSSGSFRDSWNRFQTHMVDLNLEEKINEFVTSNKENRMLQFLAKYSQMVTRLFTFIEATRSRDWILHLDALEDMLPDFASMDRINYRRYTATYIADMRHLQTNDKETWNYFMDGNFCCQKNDIPFTAIGRDHCGEQENKVLKGRGGVAGQSSNSNSTNRYFMTAPILAQIFSDMKREGGRSGSIRKFHHQLGKAYTARQNKWITSLLQAFEKHNLSLSSSDEPFRNIITGQLFSDTIYNDLIGAYEKGKELYLVFAEERLKPESKISILAKLKKANLKTCKSANKAVKIKYKDQVATLKEENIFISRIAMIRGTRDVDMKAIIGNYEMTPVVHSLMRRDGVLLDGWEGKSDLATRIRNEAGVAVITDIPSAAECVAIDAMFLMNQISTKPMWVKNGSDLAKE